MAYYQSIRPWVDCALTWLLSFSAELSERPDQNNESVVKSVAVLPPSALTISSRHLTSEEENQIRQQLQRYTSTPNKQVLWTGILCEQARQWADKRGFHTLSTAMGPLMIKEHPSCCKSRKSPAGWSQYVKGASAVFAGLIVAGEVVTVLSPSPPERFHPSGQTNYQTIEEPILKAFGSDATRFRIEMVHPLVKGAEDFRYQIWPVDETDRWIEQFGIQTGIRIWRPVKGFREIESILKQKMELTGQSSSKPAIKNGRIEEARSRNRKSLSIDPRARSSTKAKPSKKKNTDPRAQSSIRAKPSKKKNKEKQKKNRVGI